MLAFFKFLYEKKYSTALHCLSGSKRTQHRRASGVGGPPLSYSRDAFLAGLQFQKKYFIALMPSYLLGTGVVSGQVPRAWGMG